MNRICFIVNCMSPHDLTNRSDIYLFDQAEAAAEKGDLCAHKKIIAEMRRRVRKMRTENADYHIDDYLSKPAAICRDA